jgi:hypothetical protein
MADKVEAKDCGARMQISSEEILKLSEAWLRTHMSQVGLEIGVLREMAVEQVQFFVGTRF